MPSICFIRRKKNSDDVEGPVEQLVKRPSLFRLIFIDFPIKRFYVRHGVKLSQYLRLVINSIRLFSSAINIFHVKLITNCTRFLHVTQPPTRHNLFCSQSRKWWCNGAILIKMINLTSDVIRCSLRQKRHMIAPSSLKFDARYKISHGSFVDAGEYRRLRSITRRDYRVFSQWLCKLLPVMSFMRPSKCQWILKQNKLKDEQKNKNTWWKGTCVTLSQNQLL